MPEKDTAYTREGTIAHAMAEAILRDMLAQDLTTFPEPAEYLTSRSSRVSDAVRCRSCYAKCCNCATSLLSGERV